LLFKEQRPFKLKKEYPSEQWQIISFRLIPLKTPVIFHWTVPLMMADLKQTIPTSFNSVRTITRMYWKKYLTKTMHCYKKW
jgi:hypothetical protein